MIGTEELKEKFKSFSSNYIDIWYMTNNQFDPKEVLVEHFDAEGYEWDVQCIFKNKNNTFAYVSGSGCSCDDPSVCDVEIFPNVEALIVKLNSLEKTEQWTDRYTRIKQELLHLQVGNKI